MQVKYLLLFFIDWVLMRMALHMLWSLCMIRWNPLVNDWDLPNALVDFDKKDYYMQVKQLRLPFIDTVSLPSLIWG